MPITCNFFSSINIWFPPYLNSYCWPPSNWEMSLFIVFKTVVQFAHNRWSWSLWSLYPLMALVSLTIGSRFQAYIICNKIISRSRQAILQDLQLSTTYTSTGWSVAFSTLLSFTQALLPCSSWLLIFLLFTSSRTSHHRSLTTFLPWLRVRLNQSQSLTHHSTSGLSATMQRSASFRPCRYHNCRRSSAHSGEFYWLYSSLWDTQIVTRPQL